MSAHVIFEAEIRNMTKHQDFVVNLPSNYKEQ